MPPLDNDVWSLRTRQPGDIHQPAVAEPESPPGWSGLLEPDAAPPPGSLVVSTDDDGNVTVKIQEEERPPPRNTDFDENLAERPELFHALSDIATDLIEGVEADIASRSEWIANWSEGVDLLALKIDQRANTKGQKRNLSKVRDTTLLETIVKAQSQARGELLPANGPAKVTEVPEASEMDDQLASDFESDFNLALTKGMPEYVPDLDRGLFSFFYGGNMFRIGLQCPIKGRPMVLTCPTEDLIVSEEASSLDTATRVTHRIPKMSPMEVKRRQFYGVWRQVDLSPAPMDTSPERQKLEEVSGIRSMSTRQKDQPFTIYATITDLDLAMYGLEEKGAPRGLPLPYKVTMEKYSRQVLRIERYWKDGDERFSRKRRIVHYSMVPGFGFLALGFLHLQGNQVKALTAIVRLLIDAMMFANFPGGAKVKTARTETNELEPGPGEWVEVGVPGTIDDIRKVLMAFPYKDISPVAVQLYNLVQQAATRVGAAAMLEVGEGRANIPVGTIMAMLEEKSVVMSAIHKRMHTAMSEELSMIRELFMERPETLAQVCPNPKRQWAVAGEFANLDLVPASDPNVPSQVHRIMLATALATLVGMPAVAPFLDPVNILKRVLRMIGISDVDNAVRAPQQQAPQIDPAAAAATATLQAKQLDVQAKAGENQRKAANEAVSAEQKQRESALDAVNQAADRASQERIAGMREDTERLRLASEQERANRQMSHEREKTALDHANAQADRESQAMGPRTFGGGTI